MSGAACSVARDDSTVAPTNAPTAPGAPSLATIAQSMFLNFQCDKPDAKVVPTSARCTAALAWAAPMPDSTSSVVAVTPNAIPRAPSTSCAPAPTSVKMRSDRMGCFREAWPPGGDRNGRVGARQERGQHHSSKAISRRDGQKGSSAHTSDGAGATSTRSTIDVPHY